ERVPGGFAGVYPVLKAFEEAGRCRRGYFVEGLGGAQFAHPGAVDRLRALGPADGAVAVLAATDPANPYGAALPWPERGALDAGRGARRARRSCWSPDGSCSTSGAAAARCSPTATTSGWSSRPRRRWRWSPGKGGSAGSRSSAPTARRCSTRRSRARSRRRDSTPPRGACASVPEGDTVFLAATRLHAALAGQTLTRTDFRVPRLATVDLAG